MKNWLENRKIYFETIAATALTIMSIAVSWGSWRVSERQLALAEAEVSPVLELTTTNLYRGDLAGPLLGEEKNWNDFYVTIDNYGAPIHPVQLESRTILFLGPGYSGRPGSWIRLKDPLDIRIESGESGRIANIREVKSFLDPGFSSFLDAAWSACAKGNRIACGFSNDILYSHVLRFEYRDKFGGKQEKYFQIASGKHGQSLPERELKSLYDRIGAVPKEFTFLEIAGMRIDSLLAQSHL
jgi:hypothetical protein